MKIGNPQSSGLLLFLSHLVSADQFQSTIDGESHFCLITQYVSLHRERGQVKDNDGDEDKVDLDINLNKLTVSLLFFLFY